MLYLIALRDAAAVSSPQQNTYHTDQGCSTCTVRQDLQRSKVKVRESGMEVPGVVHGRSIWWPAGRTKPQIMGVELTVTDSCHAVLILIVCFTRSSADADNRRDAFKRPVEVNKHGTILGPLRLFANHVTATTRHKSVGYWYVTFILSACCSSDATGYTFYAII